MSGFHTGRQPVFPFDKGCRPAHNCSRNIISQSPEANSTKEEALQGNLLMLTTILGFAIIIALVLLIMKEKACAPIIFAVLPVIAAMILGYSVSEIVPMYVSGFSKNARNAVLAMFSVSYFFMMNEVGAFDPIVNAIVKRCSGNIILVFIAATIISMVTTLDGQSASTIVVTAPVMYPIFKKMKIRPENLAFIITVTVGVFMYLPYTSAMMAVSTALEVPVEEIWSQILPSFGIGIIACFVLAVLMAINEKKRIAAGKNDYLDAEMAEASGSGIKELTARQKKLLPFNWIMTVILMICLFTSIVDSAVLFVFMFALCVFVNYPNSKEQVGMIRKSAPMAMFVAVIFLIAGGYSNVMQETGMMDAMVGALLGIAPEFMMRFLHDLIGVVSVPLNFFLGADTFYFGLVPLAGNIATSFGVPVIGYCITVMIGKGIGMLCSPTTPNLYLLTDMCHVSTKSYFKFTFLKLWAFSVVILVLSWIFGIAAF